MFSKLRNFFNKIRQQLALGFSNILAASINAIFWLVIASILTKNEYGEVGFLLSIAAVGSAFAAIGLPRTIIVYGAKGEEIYHSAYALGQITAVIAGVITFFLTQNIIIGLLTWGLLTFNLMMADLNSTKKYLTYSKLTVARRILSVVFALSLYPLIGINGILLGYFVGTLPALSGLYKFFKSGKFVIKNLKTKTSFMLSQYLTGLAYVLFWSGNKIIIGSLFGMNQLGTFQLAIQYLVFLNAIALALRVYLMPQESQGIRNKKLKQYVIPFSVGIVAISILIIPYAVTWLLPEYVDSILSIQITSIAFIPIIVSEIFEVFFLGREHGKLIFMAAAIHTGTFFGLIVLLGSEFGVIGFAFAFLISSIIRAVFNIITCRVKFQAWP